MKEIKKLHKNQIFVFGSNLAGRHGKGAAKIAVSKFGAKYGQGDGLQGQSYALPTKDEKLGILSLKEIGENIAKFISFAKENRQLEFLVTPIGCGLAGYKYEQIALLFSKHEIPDNVKLPPEFLQWL